VGIYRRKSRNGKRSKWLTAEFEYRGKRYMKGGFADRESAQFWMRAEQNRLRRGAVGFSKPMMASKVVPLIKSFVAQLLSKGRDAKYAEIAEYRLLKLASECGWVTLANVTIASFDQWRESGPTYRDKPISKRTINQYLDIAGAWGAWLATPAIGRLATNPFASLDRVAAKHNDDYRRAATVDELNGLLATCSKERRLYYLFRIYTPLRGRTIGALTWSMMHLDATPPFIQTPAEINKSRKAEKYAVRYDIAQELRSLKKTTKAAGQDPVFPDAPALRDFKADLKAAGVDFSRGGNQRLDFHALRCSLVSLAKNAGLTEFQVMDLLGHRDIRTTMKWYHKASITADKSAAIEKLPELGTIRRAQ
jgi:integrase